MTHPSDFLYPKMDKLKDVEDGAEIVYNHTPLTKREYFAALAMQGILAKNSWQKEPVTIAMNAVTMADSLIQVLNATNPNVTNQS